VTTESGQANDQSSSSSSGQQTSQASSSAAQGGAADQQSQQQTQNSAAVERPAYIPEKYWDGEKKAVRAEDFTRDYNDLTAFKTEADVRKAAIPASPDKYEPKLPADFKAPEGMEFQLNAEDPALKQFREIAHKKGMDQDTFSEALGAFAAVKIAEHQQLTAGRTAEMAKLGATADTRIDQVATWLTAKVGDKAAPMIAQLKQFPLAANVEAFEGIIRAFTAQGGTNFNQSGRETEPTAAKSLGTTR
jgi:hypothetical protein